MDFGETLGVIGGVECKLHYFVMALPHSDAIFIKAYPAETTEAYCDGHNAAFACFGGVPLSALYDNTKIAVAKICSDGARERIRSFAELHSHYLFDDKFGRPAMRASQIPDAWQGALAVGQSGSVFCFGFPAFAQVVAVAVPFQDVDVMREPVEDGPGQALCSESFRPFVEWPVRCDDDRPAFVSLADDFKQQFRAGLAERHEAQVVDDQ